MKCDESEPLLEMCQNINNSSDMLTINTKSPSTLKTNENLDFLKLSKDLQTNNFSQLIQLRKNIRRLQTYYLFNVKGRIHTLQNNLRELYFDYIQGVLTF
ncbi:unnamed protein product [Caenorhabditis angaria]|uniref:Uncharacterized protein n=1 Tax=Caenorhabditis angaria TaxID=860376 RepID=A0A9P1N940_9PELO|nr:unnamed protein product [Caenorhabditis angaria]